MARTLCITSLPTHRRSQVIVCSARQDILSAAHYLACKRARHYKSSQPLYVDPYASALCNEQEVEPPLPGNAEEDDFDNLATALLDTRLLEAVQLINMDLEQETRQVILLGCGLDTRPHRLPWPEGTVIFDVAPADAHAVAAAALKAADAHVPRACLLRRVVADYAARPSFQPALAAGGLRGDRLSVWALQGLPAMGLEREGMRSILMEVAELAAYSSVVVGELPRMTRSEAEDLLGEAGMLGMLQPESLSSSSSPDASRGGDARREDEQRWLFLARCQQRSSAERDIYSSHVAAMEEAGEDFFGNFS
ncbi:g2249 [Coccomyxa viridis]|uniref:G2249 protein n=1 Tax=Coccomyxa viridis TaxID=1274662 RepID=A0ABP1FJX5_9CHLO